MYRSLNDELREKFGEKVYKLALEGGFSCPNRDGKLGTKGCIFCLGGSGDFAEKPSGSVFEQNEGPAWGRIPGFFGKSGTAPGGSFAF